jgi:thioester reductase-like protein
MTRYRPGEVGGDSLTGRSDTEHFILACLKGFLQFGAFPALDIKMDVAPIDYVAKAIVYLALNKEPLGQAYHLTNPSRQPMSQALSFLRGLGYRFEELPFEELRDRLVTSPGFSSNALFPYQAALDDMDATSMQLPTYDTRQALRELQDSGISCPPADIELFDTYLRYLQGIGFLPQPEALINYP